MTKILTRITIACSTIIYFFKVNNGNTRKRCEIRSLFLLLTLNIFHTFPIVSIADFEKVNINLVLSQEKGYLEKNYLKKK